MSHELEVSLLRKTFGVCAERWIPALEAALEADDEFARGSVYVVRRQLAENMQAFDVLNARRKEIGKEADEICDKLNNNEASPIDLLAVVQLVGGRVKELHAEAVQSEKEAAWVFIQAMVSLRKIKQLMEDALPGSGVRIEQDMRQALKLE